MSTPARKISLFDRLQDWVWSHLLIRYMGEPWMLTNPSPLAEAPQWYRRRLGADHLGEELACALGRNPPQVSDRHAALGLAKLGASPWYDRGHCMHRTNLQVAVSEGWCDVVEELIGQETARIKSSPLFSWLWERHLASLWMEVYSDEMENMLTRLAPLERAWPHMHPKPALFRLAERLVQRGRIRSLGLLYPRLPHYAKELVVRGLDVESASLNGVLFALSHVSKEDIQGVSCTGKPIIHTLALDPAGLDFLLSKNIAVDTSLDEAGNNAWLEWCLHARRRHFDRFGLEDDTPEYREASFHALLRTGLDPEHCNKLGISMAEQAHCELASHRWTLMRRGHSEMVRQRIAMLQGEVIARQLARATCCPADNHLLPRRL